MKLCIDAHESYSDCWNYYGWWAHSKTNGKRNLYSTPTLTTMLELVFYGLHLTTHWRIEIDYINLTIFVLYENLKKNRAHIRSEKNCWKKSICHPEWDEKENYIIIGMAKNKRHIWKHSLIMMRAFYMQVKVIMGVHILAKNYKWWLQKA